MTDDDDHHRRHDDVLHVVNCHLSGGSAPERRLRQVNDGLEQIRKWTHALKRDLAQRSKVTKKRPPPSGGDADGAVVGDEGAERMLSGYRNAGIAVCGDFKSDGNMAVRRLLVDGRVDPDWREPQYPDLPLSSRIMEQTSGPFADAAELAYGGNVCDGDYPESRPPAGGARPATYVVPNLASLLLSPMSEAGGGGGSRPPRTEFGTHRAFELVNSGGNGCIDEDEVSTLLENMYVATYGQQIE
jgi:hypothetical protein